MLLSYNNAINLFITCSHSVGLWWLFPVYSSSWSINHFSFLKSYDLTFNGMLLPLYLMVRGFILFTLFSLVKKIGKVNFWDILFCMVLVIAKFRNLQGVLRACSHRHPKTPLKIPHFGCKNSSLKKGTFGKIPFFMPLRIPNTKKKRYFFSYCLFVNCIINMILYHI